MPERKIVSPSQLNAWLAAQIKKVDGCKDCELTWKYRLREPEKHGGCNWSELSLRYGEGTDHDTAVKAALTIEREAFEQFNLEEEPPPPPHATREFKANMLPRLLRGPVFHLDANVTMDGGSKEQPAGILGNRDRLREQFDIRILRPDEAVEFIRGKIAERDEFNAQVAALTGAALPEWAGRH